jgi:hypothetical protein
VTLNFTTILDGIFLVLAALILFRFFRTGGTEMLRQMDRSVAKLQHSIGSDAARQVNSRFGVQSEEIAGSLNIFSIGMPSDASIPRGEK